MAKILEWTIDKKDFELIVDEMYFNFIHNPDVEILSGLNYANKYPNIHVIRGFSKDYGMSGVKVGLLVSCHEKVR